MYLKRYKDTEKFNNKIYLICEFNKKETNDLILIFDKNNKQIKVKIYAINQYGIFGLHAIPQIDETVPIDYEYYSNDKDTVKIIHYNTYVFNVSEFKDFNFSKMLTTLERAAKSNIAFLYDKSKYFTISKYQLDSFIEESKLDK
ncbi:MULTISPECIES: hypothetical protein [unclassified Acinetobacter]|uniref:hypothetical protein n=1 Tax=unclassified Acinetobacter TaxID=196816 RepID=UPI00124CB779|nr:MULTISPECIES: hypothetical protein [unclassified Acinetobacter]